jgi:hypothetical protein
MFRPSVVVVSVALGLAVVLGSMTSSAVPACKDGEERVGDKCRAVCAPGTARSMQPPWACVSTAPVLTCKAGEEPIGDKCHALCPVGQTRNAQGVCTTTRSAIGK